MGKRVFSYYGGTSDLVEYICRLVQEQMGKEMDWHYIAGNIVIYSTATTKELDVFFVPFIPILAIDNYMRTSQESWHITKKQLSEKWIEEYRRIRIEIDTEKDESNIDFAGYLDARDVLREETEWEMNK